MKLALKWWKKTRWKKDFLGLSDATKKTNEKNTKKTTEKQMVYKMRKKKLSEE